MRRRTEAARSRARPRHPRAHRSEHPPRWILYERVSHCCYSTGHSAYDSMPMPPRTNPDARRSGCAGAGGGGHLPLPHGTPGGNGGGGGADRDRLGPAAMIRARPECSEYSAAGPRSAINPRRGEFSSTVRGVYWRLQAFSTGPVNWKCSGSPGR
ncbi:hypothetical protein GQ55_7G249500 [Panicum hallii var. hallii]|uniref:Uncharacterized protein n=1 Tax=Panicum hallii var. hallii TaxID=1504633 RepID=A0A2T7CZ26_9POAL|nr:hypothetical protein GQ55_7G249500 [Panicum hallii var. hallii]